MDMEKTLLVTKASMGKIFVTGVIKLLDSSKASEPRVSPPTKKRCGSLGSLASVASFPEARVILETVPLPQRVRKIGINSSTPAKMEERPRKERTLSSSSPRSLILRGDRSEG